ncbi:MAG: DUF6179 domain-containing protein [Streptococcaceae bacterium]|jgi:hypothetical protein|nr:DUF6179 domain-containing protein [Streptococcaceae bacterium]
MNEVSKKSQIDKNSLSQEFYFQTLISEARAKNLVSDSDIQRLQYESLLLLKSKTRSYNGGEDSSIPKEVAESIMTSNFFTISMALKAYESPDAALAALKNLSLASLYQKGHKRIQSKLITSKVLHQKLLKQIIDTDNVFYQGTLVDAFKGFFKLYNPDFSAQEIHITADYVPYNPVPKLAGIEFISSYLKALYLENLLLTYFSSEKIHQLLLSYQKNYQEMLINIYERVLIQAVGCVVLGKDFKNLELAAADLLQLQDLFSGMSKADILDVIMKALQSIIIELKCPQELSDYLLESAPAVASTIEVESIGQALENTFLVIKPEQRNSGITVSMEAKMEDGHYRHVLQEINEAEDKVAAIKEKIRTFSDLEDVLVDADLTASEIKDILSSLSSPELAFLSKNYLPALDSDIFELTEREERLASGLQQLISSLSESEQKMLQEMTEAMTRL